MKRSLILTSAIALALVAGGCAGTDKKSDTASATKSAKDDKAWWKIPKSWRGKEEDEPWQYGDVRKGKGLLSDDKDGFTVYRKSDRGSSDPSKPEKVKR